MSTWRRAELREGIYDEIVSERLASQLAALPSHLRAARRDPLATEDLSAPLATLLRDALDLALAETSGSSDAALALADPVLATLRTHVPRAFPREDELRLTRERLRAIFTPPVEEPRRPRGSLVASQLLANAEGESLLEHLRSEFESADRVDLLCAFVKLSGVEKLRAELERHAGRGRPLRVLTTTYMGATDAKAVEKLARLPHATVKVSFDEQATRLHAKAWIFHRDSGLSTAYVGSSNLSHAAQTDGLEWNVRVTAADQPGLVSQMAETFAQYWADHYQFEPFDPAREADRQRLHRALSLERRDRAETVLFELSPKDYQTPILDELAAARQLGRHRNLIVAATGTGKTVMAALDYRALRAQGAVDSLLFVAHRREILEQSRRVFRHALQLRDFGELLHQGERPADWRHVFASIDSLAEAPVDLERFDMVILDEAHHTAADSWGQLLRRVRPKELVGLTGTPERADGLDYGEHFPRPWIGELRVWNAIPHALVPFRYYMLDVAGIDLRDVAWRAGQYARGELSGKLVGAADVFVQRAVRAVHDHVALPGQVRAIAFCVDVAHAQAVATRFAQAGFVARVLTGETAAEQRRDAQADLNAGRVQVLCVVDIYNEGVDVPNVNTLFFFRPTESASVFLQQLGRGLRRAPGKAELVVFDLTGRQRMEFRFDRRLRALLGHTPRELREFVAHGFGRLPAGCHIEFEEQAQRDVLAQLRRAVPDDTASIVALLREPSHAELSLERFLHETDVELEDVYRREKSWTELRRSAGLASGKGAEWEEQALQRVHKLLHVGDARRLGAWAKLLEGRALEGEAERRAARMLGVVLFGKNAGAVEAGLERLAGSTVLRAELAELMPVLQQRNAVLAEPYELSAEVPLVLHARYLGAELSAAFDHRTKEDGFRDYFTGVEAVGGGRWDLLLVTLEKGAGTKEHLRYRDFPLDEQRFHWQSKARTTRESREGRRHVDPAGQGCTPLLFVRERADERPGVTMGFRYLGPVSPERIEGERPVTVEWRLAYRMPRDAVRAGRVAG